MVGILEIKNAAQQHVSLVASSTLLTKLSAETRNEMMYKTVTASTNN